MEDESDGKAHQPILNILSPGSDTNHVTELTLCSHGLCVELVWIGFIGHGTSKGRNSLSKLKSGAVP